MSYSLTQVDVKDIDQHYYLEPDDSCLYFGEYTAREGYSYSRTNQLIHNFKKSVDRKGRPEYLYKERAINEIASLIFASIRLDMVSFVPVPPSKSKGDALYDDRLIRVLSDISQRSDQLSWRELVTQRVSTVANHQTNDRLAPMELANLYDVIDFDPNNLRETVIIFDDMLTTGCHFKAMQHVLRQRLPNKRICGLFVARRVISEEDVFGDF